MPTDPSATSLTIDVGATNTRLAIVRDGAIAGRIASTTATLAGPDGSVLDALVAAALDLARRTDGPAVRAVGIGLAAFVDEAGCVLQARDFGVPRGTVVR